MKKYILILIFAVAMLISAFASYKNPNIREAVAAVIPLGIKQKIKDTLFIVPALREELALKNTEVIDLGKALKESKRSAKREAQQRKFVDLTNNKALAWQTLSSVYSQSRNELLLRHSNPQTITADDGQQYQLFKYQLPFLPTRQAFGLKPLFYLDSTGAEFYVVTGDGVFFKGSNSDIGNDTIGIVTIPTNLRKIIRDEAFYLPGWISIKDLKIHKGKAYLSYTKKQGVGYTIAILVADLSDDTLEFNEFFVVSDPVSTDGQFNAHQTGGRIVAFEKDKLLISTGDFRKWVKPQDPSSLLGKIFSIDIETKQTEIISMGHRNVQGLHYDAETGAILSTEHGPAGGDEVNLNNSFGSKVVNFGWPIASYGRHYDGRKHSEAPLYKSHKQHGFNEPLLFFVPSIGISQIMKMPNSFAINYSNDYFTASMGRNPDAAIHSIHHFRLDQNSQGIVHKSIIQIGDRIRDMYLLDKKTLLLALEGGNTPAIGVLRAR